MTGTQRRSLGAPLHGPAHPCDPADGHRHTLAAPVRTISLAVLCLVGVSICLLRVHGLPAHGIQHQQSRRNDGRSFRGHGGRLRPTVFIVKTYGEFTEWQRKLIRSYSRQLAPAGVPVGVLRDVSTLSPNLTQVVPTALQIGDASVQQCDVSWRAAKEEYGRELLENYYTWKPSSDEDQYNGLTPGQGAHNVFEALWWKYCAPGITGGGGGGRPDFVWFTEHDAVHTGDARAFVLGHAGDDTDLVAAGFRIAGPSWWNFVASRRALEGGRWMRTFPHDAPIMPSVAPLPTMSDTPCGDEGSRDLNGLIFAQDVVERLSWRTFDLLERALRHNVYGPAETFLPTLCATANAMWHNCTMLDFAPLLQRQDGSTPVSPQYCWEAVGGFKVAQLCEAQFQDKWVHPLKVRDSKYVPCLKWQ